jgi:hypothetical protein
MADRDCSIPFTASLRLNQAGVDELVLAERLKIDFRTGQFRPRARRNRRPVCLRIGGTCQDQDYRKLPPRSHTATPLVHEILQGKRSLGDPSAADAPKRRKILNDEHSELFGSARILMLSHPDSNHPDSKLSHMSKLGAL